MKLLPLVTTDRPPYGAVSRRAHGLPAQIVRTVLPGDVQPASSDRTASSRLRPAVNGPDPFTGSVISSTHRSGSQNAAGVLTPVRASVAGPSASWPFHAGDLATGDVLAPDCQVGSSFSSTSRRSIGLTSKGGARLTEHGIQAIAEAGGR